MPWERMWYNLDTGSHKMSFIVFPSTEQYRSNSKLFLDSTSSPRKMIEILISIPPVAGSGPALELPLQSKVKVDTVLVTSFSGKTWVMSKKQGLLRVLQSVIILAF